MADPTGAHDDCGCCAGVDSETPRRIHNPPGQPAIAYRVGRHGGFKESMLARLSSSKYPQLARLGTRDDSDFTIALCDALAGALDVLTFYQERVANEHFLRTATEELSVFEMARLIGYVPAPGVAASTYVAFTLQEAPGSTSEAAAPVTLPQGLRVQSVPGPDEQPQAFETAEPTEARVEWNGIPLQSTRRWGPVFGDTDLYLEGVGTQLEPGDAILIVGETRETDPESERWDVRVVDRVEVDTSLGRTRVQWVDGIGHRWPRIEPASEAVRVFVFRKRAALFGHNAPDPRLMSEENTNLEHLVTGSGLDYRWARYKIDDQQLDLDTAYPKVTAGSWLALVSNDERRGTAALPGYVELYRAARVEQRSRTDYGLSGKITRVGLDTDENLWRFHLADTLALVQSEELASTDRPLLHPVYGDVVSLQTRVAGLVPGQAVSVSGKRQRIAVAAGVNDLKLQLAGVESVDLAEGDSLVLVDSPVELSASSVIYLDPASFGQRLRTPSARLRLEVMDRDGRVGWLTAQSSEIEMDASRDDDPVVAEIAFVADTSDAVTSDRDHTTLRLEDALTHVYERVTATLNANVARATHGETVEEVLGSGDASRPDQAFTLRQGPLTYTSADSASGRASSLALRVNDLLYAEVPSLYGRAPDERAFTVSRDAEGAAVLRFGDGVEGGRLPTGQNNVRAAYRKGLGVAGNVGAGALTTLLSRPLGLAAATNPEAAGGGEDPESLSRARQNAPLTVLTLDRAVSIQDYADYARAFPGIDKAHALWLPAGPSRGVFITVAGIDGATVPSGSDPYQNLLSALRKYGDPLVPITLADYRPARFEVQLAVKVAGDYESEAVLLAVEALLEERFGFDARAFGQGTSLDEVVAAAHEVGGVDAVRVTRLYRPAPGVEPTIEPRLSAALPVASLTDVPKAAELLTLDRDALVLEVMP